MRLLPNILCALTILLGAPGLAANISLADPSPVAGQPVRVTFSVPVDTLLVTYRPNSALVRTETVVLPAPSTFAEWTPSSAGLAQLAYLDRTGEIPLKVSHNVSVRFDGLSGSGLAVMILAGLILFGGAGFAFKTLFREDPLSAGR
ncbi:hypothetical protein QWY85_04015 [Neolewinella lacunae]|uniref:CopC domain-containing protein n=1 Tax=Neolewinella lacunae TaxID=1517758 RepID=A0A923PU28_9BACT|nr:hypothetical protein [Neolewinella lacunae]MBC6996832.1 hypothetical protein [Neolewinella lacunae]MDN3633810.1 hypothetical protein [Neolewinella lacunae]